VPIAAKEWQSLYVLEIFCRIEQFNSVLLLEINFFNSAASLCLPLIVFKREAVNIRPVA